MEVLFVWIIVAVIAAIIAPQKGRSSAGWFFLCFFLSPLAILVLFALPTLNASEPRVVPVTEGATAAPHRRPCPYCAELILPAAHICRFCSRELPQGWADDVLELTDVIGADGTVHRISPRASAVTQLPQGWADNVLELTDVIGADGTVHRIPPRASAATREPQPRAVRRPP
jgi:hypothetical protein